MLGLGSPFELRGSRFALSGMFIFGGVSRTAQGERRMTRGRREFSADPANGRWVDAAARALHREGMCVLRRSGEKTPVAAGITERCRALVLARFSRLIGYAQTGGVDTVLHQWV
jgi:hypothetical protein